MQFVLSYQNDICLLEKERICMDNYFQNILAQISGSQEDNQRPFLSKSTKTSCYDVPKSFFAHSTCNRCLSY